MLHALWLVALGLACQLGGLAQGCQLPAEWRPLSEGCRAQLAEIIVYAKVLAIHEEPYGASLGYNYLPYQQHEDGLFYAAEVELLCDQAWGSMLEVPAGSRLNLTGLGYFSCQSHTVMENYSYIFFLRMDENYNILPHGVNFQDAIFPDSLENRRTFSSLFQFSNCSHGHSYSTDTHTHTLTHHGYSTEWDSQDDSRLLCASVQQVLLEEEARSRRLQERVAQAERRNQQLRQRVRKLRRSLRKARKSVRGAARQRSQSHLNAIGHAHNPPQPPPVRYTQGL